jgi:puromycin-sensitive aminopeptidase
MSSRTENPYRLPTSIWPVRYHIDITPDLGAATFSGSVTIELDVRESTNVLAFNAIELKLSEFGVTDSAGVDHHGVPVLDEHFETGTVIFESPLAVGTATMVVSFRGILNDQLHGFYRSTYVDNDGATQTIATTQFESTDARRAFPCWDEPVFKASYNVTLHIPSDLKAYSNSPIVSSTDEGNGTTTVVFGPTMKMSTYLVAFVVGPFEESETVEVDGVPLRIVTPRGKTHLAPFALEAGAFALRFFSNYFAIPYPGDKLDMIAVPDFAFGAMENLGCVTYRDTALLVDPATASQQEVERVAEVVAHEIAHMWFGDLVTMEWWEGIWLNEAFATFMANACLDAFRPEWKVWVGFGTFRDMALQVDGLHSTRPIEFEVVSPDDSQGMFDLLTYEKGGSVLRMLELYLGTDVYRDGIRRYLGKHAYGNTITTDLWDALEEASNQPVRDIMNTWILQGGHPLVTLENGTLRQEPFAYGPTSANSNIGKDWFIPVLTRSLDGGAPTSHLLKSEPLAIGGANVVVNAGGSGVYRTRYGSAELAAISSRMSELDDLERVVLVADAWAGLFSSSITLSDFLTIARSLGSDNNPTTWITVAEALEWVNRVIDESQRDALAAIVRELFQPHLDRLGYDSIAGEDDLTPQLRAVTISALGILGREEVVRAEAVRRFDAGHLEGDTARALLRIVANVNRPGDYDRFVDAYANAAGPQEEQRFLQSLADFPEEAQALETARQAFDEFRNQDGPILLGLLVNSRANGPAVWRYLTSRWSDVQTKFAPNLHVRVTGGVTKFALDEQFANEVEAFHLAHPLAVGQRTLVQYLERMRIAANFASKIRPQV